MKIGAFYSDNPFAGWVQCEGFVDVLKRMGHEVVGVAIPPVTKITLEDAKRINKPVDDCDLIIVSGPEHVSKWIRAFYPMWGKLKAPKVAWYHESFVRDDYSLNFADVEHLADFHMFPDKRDAELYKGEWLPLGVDTEMFNPGQIWPVRDVEVGFIGLMYPKRAEFASALKTLLPDIKIDYRYGYQSEHGLIPSIAAFDFDGLNIRKSMQLLSESYRRIKVFVTFPSMSSVLVAKVLESMACGCLLIAPRQDVPLEGMWSYDASCGAEECASLIRKATETDVTKLGLQASNYVSQNHRMELRFDKIFAKVGVCVPS